MDELRALRPGIIPADAGSTFSVCRMQLFDEDHPRGCGEHRDGRT